ncbi:DUF2087 domain-containing protein [Proteiniborus sp. MB09-C3]|uniref:DUF2087 domain-containing protein n=1 Tax=Proteiniborus sp. MB09-C3 TaxID=3050072 RepID=UPI0025566A5A|nr:DUF2087 domain-containing protein [Proteiniborus sp. MB09-C3]WIV12483.1 DUF2087 domain-containing protein [Proteiniborus sp. MB09-C3]
MKNNILRFLDKEDRIKIWPSKQALKLEVLEYLSGKFECGRSYTEREVNEVINNWHTFNDYFLLRRGLIDAGLLSRTKDGAKYWREEDA